MIELFFMACLASDLKTCKPVTLTYADDALTPMQCMMSSQSELAMWAYRNPKWRVMKWRCRPARMYSKA